MSLVTGLFFPVLLLNQRWSPPLRLQASHCTTFRIMCDVPSIAVFCSEPIECFSGTASKFFLKLLVTIPVAPVITGIIVHFRFHIRCVSLYINSCILTSFPLPFAQHFCLRVLPHLSVCMFSLIIIIIIIIGHKGHSHQYRIISFLKVSISKISIRYFSSSAVHVMKTAQTAITYTMMLFR